MTRYDYDLPPEIEEALISANIARHGRIPKIVTVEDFENEILFGMWWQKIRRESGLRLQALHRERLKTDAAYRERVRARGSRLGKGSVAILAEKRRTDPEYVERMRAATSRNARAMYERFKTDPEYAERVREAGKKNLQSIRDREKVDPEFAERMRAVRSDNGSRFMALHQHRVQTDPEYAARVRAAASRSGLAFRERARTDPIFGAAVREASAQGGRTLRDRMEREPELRQRILAVRSQNGIEAAARLQHLRDNDPSYVAKIKELSAKTGRVVGPVQMKRRRRCSVCGRVNAPAHLGQHQKYSGHTGWVEITALVEAGLE